MEYRGSMASPKYSILENKQEERHWKWLILLQMDYNRAVDGNF